MDYLPQLIAMTEYLSPMYTLLLPLRVPPYTDGIGWAKRDGMERHHGIRENEEYTDEE